MRKHIIPILFFAAFLFAFIGCQPKSAADPASGQDSKAAKANTEMTDATKPPVGGEDATSEPAAEPAAETTVAAGKESTITGTLLDAAMSTLILETDDGEEYMFEKDNPDVSGLSDGLTIGDRITLTYTGSLSDGDASGANVIAISDAK